MIRCVDVSQNAHEPGVTQPAVCRMADGGIGASTTVRRYREQIVDVDPAGTRHQIAVDLGNVASLRRPAISRERPGLTVETDEPSFSTRQPAGGHGDPAGSVGGALEQRQVHDARLSKIERTARGRIRQWSAQIAVEEHQDAEIQNRPQQGPGTGQHGDHGTLLRNALAESIHLHRWAEHKADLPSIVPLPAQSRNRGFSLLMVSPAPEEGGCAATAP